MSPVVFIDANVPIYASGRPHPLKRPCAQILLMAAEHPGAFITDAEVLQELLHRYLALRIWTEGRHVLRHFSELMRGRVQSVEAGDVTRAAELADSHQLSGRDLLHAAVMQRLGITHIASADQDFERLAHVTRLDPARFQQWRASIIDAVPEQE